MNIYEMCDDLLTKNHVLSENTKSIYLSMDPTLITYTLYDNHRTFFEQTTNGIPLHQLMQAYAFITNVYVYTSVMETYFSNFLLKSISFDHNLLRLNAIQYAQCFLEQNKKVTKKVQPCKINYTTINSRSSQHFNNLKKLQKFTSTFHFSRDNAFLTCELLHEKKKHTPRLFPEHINIAQCYISNICTPDISPYIKTFKIMTNTH